MQRPKQVKLCDFETFVDCHLVCGPLDTLQQPDMLQQDEFRLYIHHALLQKWRKRIQYTHDELQSRKVRGLSG